MLQPIYPLESQEDLQRYDMRIYPPQEVRQVMMYPLEVISGYLYIGTSAHAKCDATHKHLKIKAHVNCTVEEGTR